MIASDAAFADQRSVSLAVVRHGLSALARGEGVTSTIVVRTEPTLDDMLAAELARALLSDRELPAGTESFAHYASLVREGLRPGAQHMEESVEGVYLALRATAGSDLRDPGTARRFLDAWSVVAEVVLQAAAEGRNPFSFPLFDGEVRLARQMAFLARDREVYQEDVTSGESWLCSLPGTSGPSAALIVREPRSILLKHWCRQDSETPVGEPFRLLGVHTATTGWVFSTDRVTGPSLNALAEQLQTAEDGRQGEGERRVWFDGEPFGYTLIGAPTGGSRLDDAEILTIVRSWAEASTSTGRKDGPLQPHPSGAFDVLGGPLRKLVAVLTIGITGAAVWIWLGDLGEKPATPAILPEPEPKDSRGLETIVVATAEGEQIDFYTSSHALLIGVATYGRGTGWRSLDSVPRELEEVAQALAADGFSIERVEEPITGERLREAFKGFIDTHGYDPKARLLIYFAGHGWTREVRGERKGYLVPSDAPTSDRDERGFLARALPMDQVLSWARQMEARHVLFVFDSCFSGAVFQARSKPQPPPHITRRIAGPVRQFLTAGSAGEEVPAESVFTPLFVRGLQGDADLNDDGFVTASELGSFLHDEVIKFSPAQTPQYGTIRDPQLDRGDFVFRVMPTRPAQE